MKGIKHIGYYLVIPVLIAGTAPAVGQARMMDAGRVLGDPPQIDGLLDDTTWGLLRWEDRFVQYIPSEGQEPTCQTLFKVLYDDEAIYVAIRALDTEPDRIEKRLCRRDNMEGDLVSIALDTYYDKRTAFEFIVSAAGVKSDILFSNDNMEGDISWDPVWMAKTTTDSLGWNAEMKIPYTQLRFSNADTLTWGLQVMRYIFRSDELSFWQPIPRDAQGWVSNFGEMHGIRGIKPKREVEIVPYAMGNLQNYGDGDGNPFESGTNLGYSIGLDGKVAVTNDLTLNYTVNPDFGQVEADPSVVNLTAFETYYTEKRPFFVEGNNIFNFKPTIGESPCSSDNLFYSRRIGRSPHHEPETDDCEYLDMPDFTTILGAFKLSGKTSNGWSLGMMESVTQRETAMIDNEGVREKEAVEPLTNYFNARIQKDIRKGETIIGGMITATNRSISDSSLDFLHQAAYTGGLDYSQYFSDRVFRFDAMLLYSYISGSAKAIREVQESPVHYFQRPDIKHVRLDTNRTSLAGHGGTLQFSKLARGHWRYIGYVTWRSPGLELNDMGYLRRADNLQQVLWVSYRLWEPFSIFRSLNINSSQWTGWDFSGDNLYNGIGVDVLMNFKNYWSVGAGMEWNTESVDRSNLRGGPSIRTPGGTGMWLKINSDPRKKLTVELGGYHMWGTQGLANMSSVWMGLSYQPVKSLRLSIEPKYETGFNLLQYVETIEDLPEYRYLMGRIDQEMISADIRINLSLTPDLSIQYWGQPFVFAGNYRDYKKAAATMSDNFSERFYMFNENEISYDPDNEMFYVKEDGGGGYEYSFENPDFKVFEFRSNLVVRWEYVPGSAVYVVWSQGRGDDQCNGSMNFRNDFNDLFDIKPHNIFLIKFTYRLSI